MPDFPSEALNDWRQWSPALTQAPTVVKALNQGKSHQSWLLKVSDTDFWVLRINSPVRALAATLQQEKSAMHMVGNLAPAIIYSNDHVLITEFSKLPLWQGKNHLEVIAKGLLEIHQCRLSDSISSLDLVECCLKYIDAAPPENKHTVMINHGLRRLMNTQNRYPQRCLCHNDLNPTNILANHQNCKFLDWEYAAIHSPWFDLASLVEFSQLNDQDTKRLLRAYTGQPWQPEQLQAIEHYQFAVRFTEWLWYRASGMPVDSHCFQRLLALQ